jgi:hypothetical protein
LPGDRLSVRERGPVNLGRADPYLARSLPAPARARLAAASSFAEALTALRVDGSLRGFTGFAFAAYAPDSTMADLRLGFTDGDLTAPPGLKALGLRVLVQPPMAGGLRHGSCQWRAIRRARWSAAALSATCPASDGRTRWAWSAYIARIRKPTRSRCNNNRFVSSN